MNGWKARAVVVMAATVALLGLATSAASAADGAARNLADGGGLLGPFTGITTSDGLPASRYELSGGGNSIPDVAMRFLMGGLFALSRTVTGFACWVVDWVYRFPVISSLSSATQHIADAYGQHVVTPLGLAGVFTAWAFAFGLYLIARGRAARGFGEILLTLLIAAIATTSLVRPDVVLGHNGPLQQAQRAALEAASITTQSTSGRANVNPCDSVLSPDNPTCRSEDATVMPSKERKKACASVDGPARDNCLFGVRSAAEQVSRPITRTLSDVLIVQPYQLLQFGRLIKTSSPLYKDYKLGLVVTKDSRACELLKDKARALCEERSHADEDLCDSLSPAQTQEMDSCKEQPNSLRFLRDDGAEGKAAADYNATLSWDRVLGALFVLLAALVMAVVVLAMGFAMIAAQFACVVAAAGTYVVFMWALLPGPNRMVLWRWIGIFASSTVVLFGISVFIPLFGVAAKTLLADGSTQLIERLLLLDGLAVTALVMHRRMVAKGSNLGHAFASRIRYAKIGGSHMMGDQAAGMGMALASMGLDQRGGGSGYSAAGQISLARSSNSPAHAAFAARRAKLASGMAALSNTSGLPSNPLGVLGEARAEARRALAPLSVPLRVAQIAWTGPPRHQGDGEASSRLQKGGSGGSTAPWVIDQKTGQVLSDPAQGVNPVGERLRQRISRTRGGRVLLGAGRLAWHTTVGLPAAWTRLGRKKSQLTREMDRQLGHYKTLYERWSRDSHGGLKDAKTGATRVGTAVRLDRLRRGNRYTQWLTKTDPSLRDHKPTPTVTPSGKRGQPEDGALDRLRQRAGRFAQWISSKRGDGGDH